MIWLAKISSRLYRIHPKPYLSRVALQSVLYCFRTQRIKFETESRILNLCIIFSLRISILSIIIPVILVVHYLENLVICTVQTLLKLWHPIRPTSSDFVFAPVRALRLVFLASFFLFYNLALPPRYANVFPSTAKESQWYRAFLRFPSTLPPYRVKCHAHALVNSTLFSER